MNLTDAGMSESEALQTVIDKIKNAGSETEALTIAQETFEQRARLKWLPRYAKAA